MNNDTDTFRHLHQLQAKVAAEDEAISSASFIVLFAAMIAAMLFAMVLVMTQKADAHPSCHWHGTVQHCHD